MELKEHLYVRAIKILILVFLLLLLLLYGTYLYPYFEFYMNSTPKFQIVSPISTLVPQGIEYLEDENCFIVSGYQYPKGYSNLVVIDEHNNKYSKSIINSKGKEFKWHSGGVACHGDYVYVTGGNSKCYVLSKKDVLDKTKDKVQIVGTIKTDSNSSFCFVYGNCLYIGEYQYMSKFVTNKEHHMVSPHGNLNTAMVFAYPFSDEEKYGVSDKAIMALSIGSSIQGMCMDSSGKMYLSASSSKFDQSILYVYDFRKVVQTADYSYDYHGNMIPVFVFEDVALIKRIKVPPNCEGVTSSSDSVYMVFESASTRFKYGWLFGTQYVYKINTERLLYE